MLLGRRNVLVDGQSRGALGGDGCAAEGRSRCARCHEGSNIVSFDELPVMLLLMRSPSAVVRIWQSDCCARMGGRLFTLPASLVI